MRQEKQEIDQQLRAIQGSNMGSMQTFPSRRSDRAYSTDYDSRSSRGGAGRGGPSGRSRGNGRNNSMSGGNPRYSNRRDHRGGDDTEEEYHSRGGHFTNSGKYQGNRPGGGGRGGGNKQGKGSEYRRGGNLGANKEDQPNRDASSIDRGET